MLICISFSSYRDEIDSSCLTAKCKIGEVCMEHNCMLLIENEYKGFSDTLLETQFNEGFSVNLAILITVKTTLMVLLIS
ncbi:MAG: hypothetical protein ACI9O4_000737 [Chitinophagales bacterium]|jgi:hypothetical protein